MNERLAKQSIKYLLTLLRVALGVGLLYYVLSTTGGWTAAGQLLSAHWVVLGLVSLPLLGAAIESLRLGVLFRALGMYVPFIHGWRLVAVGTFFNVVMPGGTGGDVMKLYYLGTEHRGSGIEVATVLLVDRAVALFSLLVLVMGLALLNIPLLVTHAPIAYLVATAALGILVLVSLALLSFSERLRASKGYAFLTEHIPFNRYWKRVFDAVYVYREKKTVLLRAAAWSFIGHLMLAAMMALVGSVLIPSAPVLTVCLLSLLGLLANAIPITPGGIGIGEAAFDQLFLIAGFSGGALIIIAWRLGALPLCLIGGIQYTVGIRRTSRLINAKPVGLS